MAHDSEIIAQLVTRVPAVLRRRIRLHCAARGTTLVTFVTEAVVEKLRAATRGAARPQRARSA